MPDNDVLKSVTATDVDAAYKRVKDYILHTPLCRSFLLNKKVHVDLWVKAEVLQWGGAFKFRGATNRLLSLKEEKPEVREVIAYSSGNHAQAVAGVASLMGYRATILMPKDAPRIKVERTKAFGAEVVFYDRYTESREALGQEMARQKNGVIIPPYDDPYIIAGQGTAGLEIIEDCKDPADVVIIPAGGGGLSSGIGLAIKRAWPTCQIYVAEPEYYDDHFLSLQLGKRQQAGMAGPSICDAILSPIPGEITFPINQRQLSGSLVVNDQDALQAMKCAFEEFKLVVEPGGAVALAAALKFKDRFKDKKVVVVASGGNVDAEMFKRALES